MTDNSATERAMWGDLQFRIDPWDAEYGGSSVFEGFDAEAAESVDLDVESPASDWAPVAPGEVQGYDKLVFIDGVRRIDARIVALHEGQIVHGLLGSYGAGAVGIRGSSAAILRQEIGRLAVVGSGLSPPIQVTVRDDLQYRGMSCEGTDSKAPLDTLQREMRIAEATIAESLLADDTLVVADGPLTYAKPVAGLVGFVKRIFDPYLPSEKASLLAGLPPGNRTPLFALKGNQRYARYAWFMRLARNEVGQSPFAGIVRLEVADVVGVEKAKKLADETTAVLPTLASSRTFDPRAPQNLIPVGGLEKQLRHLLGNPQLIRRHIETRIAEDASRD